MLLLTVHRVHVWLDWATTITLKAVETGGLQLLINLDSDKFKVNSDDIYFEGDEHYFTREDVKQRQTTLQDKLKQSLKTARLQPIVDRLQSNLNNAARFVVPGLGTFRYQDPVFNDSGDLLIQVSYQ